MTPRAPTGPVESSLISTDRGQLEYADLRPEGGAAATVLVVHGSPGGVDQGVALGRFLVEQGLRVIAPSRPGYLRTPLASGRTPAEQADLHAALLDRLGIDRVGVLCWSGGGPSAYRFAVQHPDRVRAVVALAAVSGPFAFSDEQLDEKLVMGTGAGQKLLQLMARAAPEKLIAATIAAEGKLTKQQLAARTAIVSADDREREFVLALAVTANHAGARRPGYDNDVQQFAAITSLELQRITAPCLLVHGLADPDVPIEQSRAAAAAIPDADLVELELGTHLAFFINPAAPPLRDRACALLRGHPDNR